MALDTLSIYERLKAADLPEPAAKAIAELFRAFVEEKLVTKEHFDLKMKDLETRLIAQIKASEVRLLRWMFAWGVALLSAIAALIALR